MKHKAKSIRPFIGAKDFDLSRSFYRDFGFEEVVLDQNMSLFKTDTIAFYLQRAFVKDWIDNSMILIEVDNVDEYWEELSNLSLTAKYKTVKLIPSKTYDWGKECFVYDPSGILWHFGQFFK